jgi:hypothetical protein
MLPAADLEKDDATNDGLNTSKSIIISRKNVDLLISAMQR